MLELLHTNDKGALLHSTPFFSYGEGGEGGGGSLWIRSTQRVKTKMTTVRVMSLPLVARCLLDLGHVKRVGDFQYCFSFESVY